MAVTASQKAIATVTETNSTPSENVADADGICDDVDPCVGALDECGVCNGPGAIYECGWHLRLRRRCGGDRMAIAIVTVTLDALECGDVMASVTTLIHA